MGDNVSIRDGSGNLVPVSSESVTTLNGETVTASQLQRIATTFVTGNGVAVDGKQPLTDTQLRASDVPVSVSGVATSEKQDTLLSAVQALQTAVGLLAKLTDTQPVSIASVPSHEVTLPVDDQGANLTVKMIAYSEAAEAWINLPLSSDKVAVNIASDSSIQIVGLPGNIIGMVQSVDESSKIYAMSSVATPKFALISASQSGNNTVVAAVAGKKIRVLALVLSFSGAVNAKFQSGASGTDKTGLFYGATNTQIVLPFNKLGWFETAVGALLNLNLSGAVPVGGCLLYIEA